jgi:hypothetical protein
MEGAPREIRKTREVEGRRLEGWKVGRFMNRDAEMGSRKRLRFTRLVLRGV